MSVRNIIAMLVATVGIFAGGAAINAQVGVSSIEGFVYDESRTPIYNAYVELYNEIGTLVDRQRSSSSGRFIFRGMSAGRYSVTVRPFGTNLQEETKDLEIVTTFNRSDAVHLDFRLKVDKRFAPSQPTVVGTVYAQEVPDQARNLFKVALDDLENHRDKKGMDELEEAIKVFPTYFDALTSLGKRLVLTGSYEKGYPYLLRAIDVNPKCPDCYYTLGLAFYKLDQLPAAIKAAESAIVLQPQTPENRLLLGMVLRMNGDLPRAEKAFLSAKPLFSEPNSELYWQLALLYNKMNRNADAADALEQYLKVKHDIDDAEKRRVKDLIDKLRSSSKSKIS